MVVTKFPSDLGAREVAVDLLPSGPPRFSLVVIVTTCAVGFAAMAFLPSTPEMKLVSVLGGVLGILCALLLANAFVVLRRITDWKDFRLIAEDGGQLRFPLVRFWTRRVESWPLSEVKLSRQVDGHLTLERANGQRALIAAHWLPADADKWVLRAGLRSRAQRRENLAVIDALFACIPPTASSAHALVLAFPERTEVVAVATTIKELTPLVLPATSCEVWSIDFKIGGSLLARKWGDAS